MIDFTTDGSALIATIDLPAPGYFGDADCWAMRDALETSIAEASPEVLIITGTGDVFIRHYRVSEIAGLAELAQAGNMTVEQLKAGGLNAFLNFIWQQEIPVICAINGICMGGGLELSLCCDIRIAKPKIEQIGLPETSVGIFPAAGGTTRLPLTIGASKALPFILQGKTVSSEEALDLGILHELADEPLGRAKEIAKDLSQRPSIGLKLAKQLVRSQTKPTLQSSLDAEQVALLEALNDPSSLAAMRAFVKVAEPNP